MSEVGSVTAQSLELPLPEITTDDFVRAWSRFSLVAAAKKWDEAKQLEYLPTLLSGKLIDIYLELDEESKADMKTLRSALAEKAGLAQDALSAARAFIERTQRPEEKVAHYASQLKCCSRRATRMKRQRPKYSYSDL